MFSKKTPNDDSESYTNDGKCQNSLKDIYYSLEPGIDLHGIAFWIY